MRLEGNGCWEKVWSERLSGTRTQKDLLGSFAFLASAFLLACMASTLMGFGFLKLLLFSLIFGFVVTAIEAFSSRGWDNLTIPFAAVVVIVLFAT